MSSGRSKKNARGNRTTWHKRCNESGVRKSSIGLAISRVSITSGGSREGRSEINENSSSLTIELRHANKCNNARCSICVYLRRIESSRYEKSFEPRRLAGTCKLLSNWTLIALSATDEMRDKRHIFRMCRQTYIKLGRARDLHSRAVRSHVELKEFRVKLDEMEVHF